MSVWGKVVADRRPRNRRARADIGGTMRLDLFLWYARLAKTRGAAQALATGGHLRLDGRAIDRAHASVRVGSVLTFVHGGRVRVVRVAALPHRRGPAPEAQACYEDLAANVSQQAAAD